MLLKIITKLSLMTAFSLVILLGAGYTSYGQKDHDKGNGNGKHGDNRGEGRGNGNGKHERRQEEPQEYRQQNDNGRQYEGANQGRGNGNGKRKNQGRDERRVHNVPVPQQAPWSGGWVPPGQIHSQQVHERNAERKAVKNQEKSYRRLYNDQENNDRRHAPRYDQRYAAPQWFDQAGRIVRNGYANPDLWQYNGDRRGYRQGVTVNPYTPGAGYYARTNGYYADPNGYAYNPNHNYYQYEQYPYSNNRTSLKTSILRAIIGSILGGFGGQDNGYYDPNAYNSNYRSGPVRYTQPSYYNGGYLPQYTGYQPAYPQYADYAPPQYDNYSPYSGGLLNSLPIAALFGQRGGTGGYITQILSQVLVQGYLQGLLDGRTARGSGRGRVYYNDPYVGADGIYDFYSPTIGENRQILSEGYGLGFEDALTGRNQYDPRTAGKVNLVSLLLNNVFQLG